MLRLDTFFIGIFFLEYMKGVLVGTVLVDVVGLFEGL